MAPRRAANKTTPVIDLTAGTLTVPDAAGGASTVLRLDTPLFQTWLATANKLYVTGGATSFSCQRTRAQRGNPYWTAMRRTGTVVKKHYLGKDAMVTDETLRQAGAALVDNPAE